MTEIKCDAQNCKYWREKTTFRYYGLCVAEEIEIETQTSGRLGRIGEGRKQVCIMFEPKE